MAASSQTQQVPRQLFKQEGISDIENSFKIAQPMEDLKGFLANDQCIQHAESSSNSLYIKASFEDDLSSTENIAKLGAYQSHYSLNTSETLIKKIEKSSSKSTMFKEEMAICENKRISDLDFTSYHLQLKFEKDEDLPNTRKNSFSISFERPVSFLTADSQLPDTQTDNVIPLPELSLSTEYVELSQTSNSQLSLPETFQTLPGIDLERKESLNELEKNFIEPPKAKPPLNKVSCRERKRIIVSPGRPPALTTSMKLWVSKTNYLLDPFREDYDCWLHPSPPHPSISAAGIPRPCGKIQRRFTWQDRMGKHFLVLNFGIASKLINFEMTNQQKDGFINNQWHLSHLCGNWTCLNPAHTTVEPGQVNISRNNCFSHRSGCIHIPQCMKDKKVSLGADGKLVNHSSLLESLPRNQILEYDDDWSFQGFDDVESFMDLEESEEIGDFGQELSEDVFHATKSKEISLSS